MSKIIISIDMKITTDSPREKKLIKTCMDPEMMAAL
jgi:hypothetical protein